jgi:hypothetical protein
MGGNGSKPAKETARAVLAHKEALADRAAGKMKIQKSMDGSKPAVTAAKPVDILSQIPGLSGKNLPVSSQVKAISYGATGDVSPAVHEGLSKLNVVKMETDSNMAKHKQEMVRAPQAAIIREQELKAILLDRKNRGIFSGEVTAPGKISELQLVHLFDDLRKNHTTVAAGAAKLGLDEALLTRMHAHSIRFPEIVTEVDDEGPYKVAK